MIIAAARPQIASPQATMIIPVSVQPFGADAGGGGGGASDGAGSNSKEMALINAAASAGVALRRAFKSGGASDAATGDGAGWAGRSGRAVAPGPSVTALASTRTFGFGRNARQLGPNQHILPATTSACQSPRAPTGLYLRQSNASALWPAQTAKKTARSIAGNRINTRSAS